MITRSVTIEDIDQLFLAWHDHINASALYRQALREEMELRDIDATELRALLEQARAKGYSLDEITNDTDRFAELQALVDEQQSRSTTKGRDET
ncbi:hypothetical protein [Halobellus sp. EA9]|uniref:hypothetical protein n=1 Tax=Halobellus sp. EA9 TaxID=3421647 RepID=UPI003EBA4EA1